MASNKAERGDAPTHGVHFVNQQPLPHEKSQKNKLTEPLAPGASNYGDGAKGAHGTKE